MPLLDLFWATLWFFLFFAWIWALVITIFGDIFRSRDLSGWAKALWTLFVVFLPWLGVLIYLIVRGKSMEDRSVQLPPNERRRPVNTSRAWPDNRASSADEIAKLAELRNSGLLTEDEFAAQKAKILAKG